jgi:PIN domain nuclease of toxin-antitoxin system
VALFVTDTHALVWYAQARPRKLGKQARRTFEYAEAGRAVIYVPVLVLVELFRLVRSGQIRLEPSPARWLENLFRLPGFAVAELTLPVVLAGESLYAIPEQTDRLIAATAVHLGVPLITRDAELASVRGLKTVWS